MTLVGHEELLKVTRLKERILYFLLERDSYGGEIRKAIFDVTEAEVDIGDGTLYPALRSLEKDGFLDSYWDDSDLEIRGGNRRKMYTITPKGKRTVEQEESLRQKLIFWKPSNSDEK